MINVTNYGPIPGFTTFLGLDTFNNSGGGLLDMRNGISDYDIGCSDLLAAPYGNGVGDVTIMTNLARKPPSSMVAASSASIPS